ncbi:MAG: hypothetical protein IKA63_00810 [Clostridia bacterium]|nr:hypothetical protein [Clostridia bacterium]
MAIKRTLTWNISQDGLSIVPNMPQDGGVQGEHNATIAVFHVAEGSAWTDPDYAVYIECEDNAGNIDATEQLTVKEGAVSYLLPLAWTQYGGIATLRLVAEQLAVGGDIVRSPDAPVRFSARQNAQDKVDGLMKGRLAQTEVRVKAAADSAAASAGSAAASAQGAQNAASAAQQAANAAEVAKNTAENAATGAVQAAGRAEAAAGAAAQVQQTVDTSAKACAEYAETCQSSAASAEESAEKAERFSEIHKTDLEAIKKDIADLKYVPIDITHIANSVGVAEMGSTVNGVILSWTTNKIPVSLTVDGESVDVNAESIQLDTSITANKTFTVLATDERGATDSATTGITFLNGVYYGVGTEDTDLLTLNKKLQSGKGLTFTVNAADGQYIIYALPTRYGTPGFNVGGFDGGFSKYGTFSVTNASGYTENYDVWVSDNTGLGSTTVKVS